MFKDLESTLKNRFLVSFISKVSSSMLLPFMAIYYTKNINASSASAFIIIATIMQLFATLYGGYKTDNIGRKKIMVFGESVKVISFLIMIFQFSPYMMFALVCLINVAQGLINPAAEAMLIDLSNKENRPRVFSINYWITNISIMVGTIIGGWLFTDFLTELLVLLLLLSCVTLAITYIKIEESFEISEACKVIKVKFSIVRIFNQYFTVLKNGIFCFYTLGSILILAVELQRTNVIAVHFADSTEINQIIWIDGVRLLSLLTTLNTILVLFLTPFIINKFKANKINSYLVIGVVAYSIGYACLAYLTNMWLLLLAIVVISIGEVLYVPAKQSLLAEIIDDNNKGTYMAFNGINLQVSKIISGFFLVFVGVLSKELIAVLIFLLGIIGLIVTLMSYKMRIQEEK